MITRRLCQSHHRMYLAAFLLDLSVAVGLTAMPFFIIERIHGGTALSGTVGAVQMALYAVGCLTSARFVSRARNSLYLALIGVGMFALLFSLVPWANASALCVFASSVPFLGLALAWPAMQSWLGQEPNPEVRARHLAGFNTATAFGFTLSPLLTGPLYDTDSRLPFVTLIVLCVAVIGLVLSLMPKTAHASREEQTSEEAGLVPITRGLLYASWAATFTANGLFAAVRSVYPVRVEALATDGSLMLFRDFRPALFNVVGPATTYSWLAFLLSLCTVICFVIMGRTRAWQGRYSILAGGHLAAAASFVFLGHTRSLVIMAACFAVVGVNFGLCFFTRLYYSLAHATERHRRAAVNEGVLGAGGFVGGIGLGYATELFGIATTFQWMPFMVVLAIIMQILLLRGAFPSEQAAIRATDSK